MDSEDLTFVTTHDHLCQPASHTFLQEYQSEMLQKNCHAYLVKVPGHHQSQHESKPFHTFQFDQAEGNSVIAPYIGFSIGHEAEKTILGGHEDTQEVVGHGAMESMIKPGMVAEEEALPFEFGAGFHIKY